jgi:uncharacterized protein YoaH (UPF0181 family)
MPYATHVTYSYLDSPAITQGTPTRQYWLYRYRLSRLERRLANDERARKLMAVSMDYGGAIYDVMEQARKVKAKGKDKKRVKEFLKKS